MSHPYRHVPVELIEIRRGRLVDRSELVFRERHGARMASVRADAQLVQAIESARASALPLWPASTELAARLIQGAGLDLQSVTVWRLSGPVLCASLAFTRCAETCPVDATPIDAIGLALRVDAPVFVAEDLLEDAQTPMDGSSPLV